MTTNYTSGTKGLWDEWSMVRIVNGTKSPYTDQNHLRQNLRRARSVARSFSDSWAFCLYI